MDQSTQIKLQFQFLELFCVDFGGSFGHETRRFLGFGEGDHVADRRRSSEDHRDAIEAERDAAVRRCAVLQSFQ